MAKQQQRMMRVEQRGMIEAIQALQDKSDEELEAETRYRAHAQALLGERAAQRRDAKAVRMHFQKALAAARPQERLQFRRMAEHALAVVENRADDLQAVRAKLGADALTKGQVRMMRLMGLVAPPASAGTWPRVRGVLLAIFILLALIVVFFGGGFGIVSLIALATGGVAIDDRIFYGLAVGVIAIGITVYLLRKRRKAAEAKVAEQQAAQAARFAR